MQRKRIVLAGLGVLILASTLAWLFFPTTAERSVGPLVWVERLSRFMAYPHPAIQLDVDGVFVSDFVDTRGGADMEIENADLDFYIRSAHRSRSFRISRPADSDENFLNWKPVPDGPFRVRRFVQFAAPASRFEAERRFAIELRFRHRSEKWVFAALAALALAVVILNGTWVRSRSRAAGRWALRHRASLVAVSVAVFGKSVRKRRCRNPQSSLTAVRGGRRAHLRGLLLAFAFPPARHTGLLYGFTSQFRRRHGTAR